MKLFIGAAFAVFGFWAGDAVAYPLSACEILRNPDAYKDQKVEVRGYLTDYREHNGMFDPECIGRTLPFWADHLPGNDKAVEDSWADVRLRGGRVLVTIVGVVKLRPNDVPNMYVLVDRYDDPRVAASK